MEQSLWQKKTPNSVLPNEKAHLELVHTLAHHRKKMAPIAAA